MKSMRQLSYNFSFKYRFYPSNKQKQIIKANSDGSRFYYNHLIANKYKLDYIKHTHYSNGILKLKIIQNYEKTLNSREFRERISFLQDDYLDGYMFGTTRLNNHRAYINYWNGLQRHPKFHSRKTHPYEWKYQTSFTSWRTKKGYQSNINFIDSRHMTLPKLGKITLGHDTRDYNLKNVRIGTITIMKTTSNKFYVSGQLASDYRFKKFLPLTKKICGIDLNISNFLMTNTGETIPNPRFYTKGLPYLRRLNQRVTRRRRYAKHHHINLAIDKGYQRARIRRASFYEHTKNERRDFLEKLSTRLIENQDLIVAENLKSSNILRNHKIAQKASDCGWREFLSMLQYKAKLYSKTVILVNPAYTTQKCSQCGFICTRHNGYTKKHGKHLDLDDRYWWCPICHKYHVRDQNAAINILNRGIAIIFKKRRENLIKLKRKRKPQTFDKRPNLTYAFHPITE